MSEPKRVRSWLWKPVGDLPSFTTGYDERYVEALLRGLTRNLSPPWRLELWVDDYWEEKLCPDSFLSLIPFSGQDAGGWTRMLEIFSYPPDPGERILALGLDSLITGNCDWLFEWKEAPCGFIRDPLNPGTISNSVMTFDLQGAADLWSRYVEIRRGSARRRDRRQAGFPDDLRIFGCPSEMMLMRRYWEERPTPLLEDEPRKLLSYKCHTRGGIPPAGFDPSIVYFHGSPKPHELPREHPLWPLFNLPVTETPS